MLRVRRLFRTAMREFYRLGRPGDTAGATPELFQRVVFAGLAVEQMDDHVAIVQQDPATVDISLDPQAAVAEIFERVVDLLADRVQLTSAGTRGQHEIVEERSDFPHVENDNVARPVVFGDARCGESELQTPVGASGQGFGRQAVIMLANISPRIRCEWFRERNRRLSRPWQFALQPPLLF